MSIVRILLSLAAHFDWKLLHYDDKNVFLHGNLEEEICMNIHPGLKDNRKLKFVDYERLFMD